MPQCLVRWRHELGRRFFFFFFERSGEVPGDDDSDRPFPLPAGWVDAWTALRGRDCYAWTYDAVWQEEATRFNSYVATQNSMRKRSDRFVCQLNVYKMSSIELIGEHSIGLQYSTEPETGYSRAIHLTPSCHRGLLLTIVPNEPPPRLDDQSMAWEDSD